MTAAAEQSAVHAPRSPLEERLRALLAKTPDSALVDTVRVLGDPPFASDERRAQVWACDELEARYPAVVPVLEAWVEDESAVPRPYGVVLLEALAALGVS